MKTKVQKRENRLSDLKAANITHSFFLFFFFQFSSNVHYKLNKYKIE